jgi:hypothetical protein
MNENNPVRNNEMLYRSVRGKLEDKEYIYGKGRLRILPKAFSDKHRKPSVDRAELRDDPSLSRLNETDGIVSLIAGEVRAIGKVITKTEDEEVVHAIDVIYDPTPENLAHSQIIVVPEFFGSKSKQKYAFRLLRIALAELATENGWTLRPAGE